MKRIKEEKGITLVALIITIVVLLILAAVAIGTVRDSNIIGHAQNAAGGYNAEKIKEEGTLGNYVNTIENNIPKEEDDGISKDKILNKAYGAQLNDAGDMGLYYLMEKEQKVYIYLGGYQASTGKLFIKAQAEVSLTSEFETINITVNGSPIEISSQNALLLSVEGDSVYVTNDALYLSIIDGGNYNAPDTENIYIRNSTYDSYINN